jgi:predicted transcriptional regulator
VTPEERAQLRRSLEQIKQKLILLFCNDRGEMNLNRDVSLEDVTLYLMNTIFKERKAEICENFINIMECFGEIDCDIEELEV